MPEKWTVEVFELRRVKLFDHKTALSRPFSIVPSILTFDFDLILGSFLTFLGPNRVEFS